MLRKDIIEIYLKKAWYWYLLCEVTLYFIYKGFVCFFKMHLHIEYKTKFRMSNFAMGTILGKGFPQAQVHTVHSMSACGKPFPKIVPMAKLHSLLACAFIMST